MPMPRITVSSLLLLASLAAPAAVYAQARPTLDSTQMAALTANAMRALRPVDFVLDFKDELGLTATQQAALRTLSLALTDSASARQTRMMNRMLENPPSPALSALTSWTSDVDEKTVRSELMKQYEGMIESSLALFRDRRAVAALLTPEQAARLPELEMQNRLRAIKRP
jgi:hypothetical protein